MSLYDKIFKPKVYKLSNGKLVYEKRSRMPFILSVLFIFSFISIKITGFSLSVLIKNFGEFFIILKEIFNPNLSYFKSVIEPLFDTIKMSFLGSFLGAFVAIFFSFLASNNMVKSKIINSLTKLFFSIIRTIPTLVSALIFTYIFGLGTFAGTCAIFLFSFSYVGKLLYEQIETVNMGAYEALISMGYTSPLAFIKGIIPQILPYYLSTSLYNFEGNVRYAAILGYVGAGGLGLLINENINWRDYNRVGTILLALLITVFLIENISHYFRNKLN